MVMEEKNYLDSAIELAQKGALKPEVIEVKNGTQSAPVLLLPVFDGQLQQVGATSIKKYLDEYRTAPERREGTATVEDLTSMVDHVNRFKDENSALFASSGLDGVASSSVDEESDEGGIGKLPEPKLVAVLDYHEKTAAGAPRFGKHRTLYKFPLSEEWKVWTSKNRKVMTQQRFAQFINDHLMDIFAPENPGATACLIRDTLGITFANHTKLQSLSQGLSLTITHKVTEQRNLTSGEVVLNFTEEHGDGSGQRLNIPGGFIVGIPVFRNGERFQMVAQLRYRNKGGQLFWFFELYEPHRVFDVAFRGSCDVVRSGTSLPLFYGSPE